MHTLTPLIDAYLAQRQALGRYAPESVRSIRYRLATLARHHGDRPAGELDWRTIEAWLVGMAEKRQATRRAYLASARGFGRWLVREGVLDADPCAPIDPIPAPRSVPRAQPVEAVAAVLDACRTERDEAMVWLMLGCGLRRVEVARAMVDDYDPGERLLLVRGKGDRERIVPVPRPTADAIARLDPRPGGPIIASRNGTPLTAHTVGLTMTRLFERAGVKQGAWDGRTGHAMRHTYATDTLDSTEDLRVVKQLLGHAQLSSTEVYLARSSAAKARRVVDRRDWRVYGQRRAS